MVNAAPLNEWKHLFFAFKRAIARKGKDSAKGVKIREKNFKR